MDKNIPARLFRGVLNLLMSKTIWFSLLAVIVAAATFVNYYLRNVIYITDGDSTAVTITDERDPMAILAAEEIATTENDLVRYVAPTSTSVGEVIVTRGYPVFVEVDGERIYQNWLGGTVSDLLEKSNVTLGAHDKITHSLDHELNPYDTVVITRVAYRSYDVKVVLPKPVTTKKSSLIKLGTTRVITPGSDGMRVDTYDEILEDGVVVETVLAKQVVTKEPVEELQLYGDGSAVSNFNYSAKYPLDSNGVPVKYEHVFRNQRATGYYRGGNAWGSNGMLCEAGTVAVRSNQIPFGTKLYIRTADGRFIYGYSYANDTGSGLVDGVIDVDLFYETYKESAWNEVRWVDIYVLEWGDGKYYKKQTPAPRR